MSETLVERLHTLANAWDDTRVNTTIMALRQAAGRTEELEKAHSRLLAAIDTEGIAVGEDGYCRNWRAENAERDNAELLKALRTFANIGEYREIREAMANCLRPHEREGVLDAFRVAVAALSKAQPK